MAAATTTRVINFRAPAAKHALIDHAAQVSGKNRTDFILDASCKKAQEVLADRTHFALNRRALLRFHELVEAPLANTDVLLHLLSTAAPWER